MWTIQKGREGCNRQYPKRTFIQEKKGEITALFYVITSHKNEDLSKDESL